MRDEFWRPQAGEPGPCFAVLGLHKGAEGEQVYDDQLRDNDWVVRVRMFPHGWTQEAREAGDFTDDDFAYPELPPITGAKMDESTAAWLIREKVQQAMGLSDEAVA
jgi:hypothetical protein